MNGYRPGGNDEVLTAGPDGDRPVRLSA